MTVKITSPIPGHNGRSTFGPFNTIFENGVATIPEINEGLRQYLTARGYTIEDGEAPDTGEGDPLAGTIDEVLAAAADLPREDVLKLLEQESSGRNRKGVVEGLTKLGQEPKKDEDKDGGEGQ